MPTKHAKFLVISRKLKGVDSDFIFACESWDVEKNRLVGYSWTWRREDATEFGRREDAEKAANDVLLSRDGAEVLELPN